MAQRRHRRTGREILVDNIVTEEVRADLFETLSRLVGGILEEHGALAAAVRRRNVVPT